MEWRCWQQQYLTSSWSIRWKMHSSFSSINPLLVLWLWADVWGHQPHICFVLVLPKFCFQYNLPPPLLSLPLRPLKLFCTRKQNQTSYFAPLTYVMLLVQINRPKFLYQLISSNSYLVFICLASGGVFPWDIDKSWLHAHNFQGLSNELLSCLTESMDSCTIIPAHHENYTCQ